MGYGGKVAEQDRARELRAQSWTLAEIAAELGVARSSVSLWVRDVEFIPRARRMGPRQPSSLMVAKQREIEELRRAGAEAIGRLSEREFLIAGTALYAAEGAKRDGAVRFANTEPENDPVLRDVVATLLRRPGVAAAHAGLPARGTRP